MQHHAILDEFSDIDAAYGVQHYSIKERGKKERRVGQPDASVRFATPHRSSEKTT